MLRCLGAFTVIRPGLLVPTLVLAAAHFYWPIAAAAQTQTGCSTQGMAFPFANVAGPGLVSGVVRLRFNGAGCAWRLSSNSPAVTFEPSSGVSTGTSVTSNALLQANTSAAPRDVSIIINAAQVSDYTSVTRQNSTNCTYNVTPATINASWLGGTGSFQVEETPKGCWGSFVAIPSWVRLGPVTFSQTGIESLTFRDTRTFTYTIAANNGPARDTRIRFDTYAAPNSRAQLDITQEAVPATAIGLTGSLSTAVLGLPYSERLRASGGVAPYTLTATGLPQGLTLSNNGDLTGEPRSSGVFNVSIKIVDSSQPQRSVTYLLFLRVRNCFVSSFGSPFAGLLDSGEHTSSMLLAFPEAGCSWSMASNDPSMVVEPASGVATGTLLTIPIRILANQTAQPRDLALTVNAGNALRDYTFKFLQNSSNCAYKITPQSALVTAAGGTGSLAVAATPSQCWGYLDPVPTWLQLSATVNTERRTYFTGQAALTYTVAANSGPARQATLLPSPTPPSPASFTIAQAGGAALLSVVSTALANGTVGSRYAGALVAAGGTPPYTWSASGLPSGLTVESSTGVIRGTPTISGSFRARIAVADSFPSQPLRASADVALMIGAASGGAELTSLSQLSGFGGSISIGGGSWLEIKGVNLSTITRSWRQSDFNGATAPTSLDGVTVTVNGKAAFVNYISPNQVNVLTPADDTAGPVQILISSPAGVTSFVAMKEPLVPALLAPSAFEAGGKQLLVAQFTDGAFVAPAGTFASAASRPAWPGDIIIFYGIGFGAVSPAIPTGVIAGGDNSLTGDLSILIGGVPAQVLYKGLSPGSVGLYQFNVVVPATQAGNVPITAAIGGVPVKQELYLTIAN
jgi:uncharacterized protein (TIGR03437 family)